MPEQATEVQERTYKKTIRRIILHARLVVDEAAAKKLREQLETPHIDLATKATYQYTPYATEDGIGIIHIYKVTLLTTGDIYLIGVGRGSNAQHMNERIINSIRKKSPYLSRARLTCVSRLKDGEQDFLVRLIGSYTKAGRLVRASAAQRRAFIEAAKAAYCRPVA